VEIDIVLPAGAGREQLERAVYKQAGSGVPYRILRHSIDARRKPGILSRYRIAVGVPSQAPRPEALLEVGRRTGRGRALVVGSGPAGFFAADILERAGFRVTLVEQGPPAPRRLQDISRFESGGPLSPHSNYAFGEGGAGTFSDGKLTSRTKKVSREREYVSARYVQYGAPEEILWLAHPHIGSDRLYTLVQAGREDLRKRGVEVLFNTSITDLIVSGGRCVGARTVETEFPAELTVLAPGHSAFSLFRTLMRRGALFSSKGFALGFRIEHPRELINRAQWGRPEIPGLKAAEYRLTSRSRDGRGVYSFCMCPGGRVIPAAWKEGLNIVNGVSNYGRDGAFSNAAVVAAVRPEEIFPEAGSPEEILDGLEAFEARAHALVGPHAVPGTLPEFLTSGRTPSGLPASSHPFRIEACDYREIFPGWLLDDLSDGLEDFSRKLRGFGTGLILGVETTSSAVLQVRRTEAGECENIPGLYIAGEGSGSAGGIMSSAVDGIRTALAASR
jgi:uncharacterized protein